MDVINNPVLVLNQDYRPINVCRVKRAVVMLFQGKVEVVENGLGMIYGFSCALPIPSVVRLACLVKRPRFQKKLTRFEVFNRDKHTCQYCGLETRRLTLDHIVPRSWGGTHDWKNVVSCCLPCNLHKAGRTPTEARMQLIKEPLSPRPASFYIPYMYLNTHSEWQKFLSGTG